MDNVLQIDKQILNSDKIICRHINNLCNSTRGEISQDILSQLRHFVEHILLKIYANGNDIEDTQDNVKQAVKYAKNQEWLRYLSRFHHFLQVSVSHRTLEEENSERLMLKYYEYLLRIKTMLHDKYSLDVLYNLEQFPIETDESLNEYYLKIVQKVDEYKKSSKNMYKYDRFYIQNIKPFFCNNKIYYEVAFIPANDKASKTDRIIAFTDREITDFYAVKLAIEDDYIEIFDKCMPIRIILDWEVSIRPCEFKNFSKIINNQTKPIGKAEERELVKYLTESGRSLAEIVVYSDEKYNEIRNRIVPNREGYHFFDLLDFCRQLIKNQGAGYNVLRYLLHHMNNRVTVIVLVLFLISITGIVTIKTVRSIRYFGIMYICGMNYTKAQFMTILEMTFNSVLAFAFTTNLLALQKQFKLVGKINCNIGMLQMLFMLSVCIIIVLWSGQTTKNVLKGNTPIEIIKNME